MPERSADPSVCPSCGAPAGKGPACEFCGAALPGSAGQVEDPLRQVSAEEWLKEEPAVPPPSRPQQPFSRPESSRPYSSASSGGQQPFAPPPAPSGLEPFSLAMGEGVRAGQAGLRRYLKPVLIGCAMLLLASLCCGAVVLFALVNQTGVSF
jgi:hypothetical protein